MLVLLRHNWYIYNNVVKNNDIKSHMKNTKRFTKYSDPELLWCSDIRQCFSTFVRPRPGKYFFIRRGPGPNKFTCKYLSNSKFVFVIHTTNYENNVLVSGYQCVKNEKLQRDKHGFFFHCFTVQFDSLNFIHTNSCTFSYNHVLVF